MHHDLPRQPGAPARRLAFIALTSVSALALAHPCAGQSRDATIRAQYAAAVATFRSAQQPESVPMFAEVIDELRTRSNRNTGLTELLILSYIYRAHAVFNRGDTTIARDDLAEARRLSPRYNLKEPGLSPSFHTLWSTTAPALLHITVSPSDSVVTVNEQTIDPRSGPVAVAPGEIRLTAESRRRSHGPDTRALSVTAGEDVRVDIRLPRVEPRGVPRRVMAAVNLGYHLNDQPSSSGFPFTIYSNNGSSSVHYKVARGFQEYDLGLSVRAWGALAVGVTHSVLETTSTGNISAQIPHPVLANAPRVLLADAQTSGGLLIAVAPDKASTLVRELRKRGTPASALIGRIVARRGDLAIELK